LQTIHRRYSIYGFITCRDHAPDCPRRSEVSCDRRFGLQHNPNRDGFACCAAAGLLVWPRQRSADTKPCARSGRPLIGVRVASKNCAFASFPLTRAHLHAAGVQDEFCRIGYI
jgi:hypothetical protein